MVQKRAITGDSRCRTDWQSVRVSCGRIANPSYEGCHLPLNHAEKQLRAPGLIPAGTSPAAQLFSADGTPDAGYFPATSLLGEETAMNARDFSLSLTAALLRTEAPSSEEAGQHVARNKPPLTIAISREAGALGNTVAAAAGKLLNWPVYDQEIINKVAEEMGKPSSHVRGVDEKYFTWLEEVMANLLSDYHVSPAAYLKNLIATVRGLGAIGNCIVVGRAASFILPPETTLRIRLVAELPDRIRTIGRRLGVADKQAAHWIEKTEHERTQFVLRNFGKDPRDPHYYHLLMNTSEMPAEECAEVIAAALHLFEKRPLPAARAAEALAAR
jgi:cytidylate kinase